MPAPLSLLAKRHSKLIEKRPRLSVSLGCRDYRNIQSRDALDGVVVDLRENDLLGYTEGIVAMPVERVRVHAAKVLNAGQSDVDEAVEEVVHPVTPKRYLRADLHARPNLEVRDGLARLSLYGLLPGDLSHLRDCGIEHLLVLNC